MPLPILLRATPACHDWRIPPWAADLPAAAAALRDLLFHVDATSVPLWGGDALVSASVRYQEIFLPMYAAHLAATGVVVLSPTASTRIALLTGAAARLAVHSANFAASQALGGLTDEETAPWKALRASPGGVAGVCPVPPLDVALVWAAARLDAATYEADCVAAVGTPLPVGVATDDGHGGLSHPATSAASAHVWVGNATTPASVTARLQWYLFASALLPVYLWPPTDVSSAVTTPIAYAARLPHEALTCQQWKARPGVAIARKTVEELRSFTTSLLAPALASADGLVAATVKYVRWVEDMEERGYQTSTGVRPCFGDASPSLPSVGVALVWAAHRLSTAAYMTRPFPGHCGHQGAAIFGDRPFPFEAISSADHAVAGTRVRAGHWPRGIIKVQSTEKKAELINTVRRLAPEEEDEISDN
ncbi:hypothetical protein MMPV_008252 [Pyropia vietnamensis]